MRKDAVRCLHNEQIRDLYCSLNKTRVIFIRIIQVRCVARMMEKFCACKYVMEETEGNRPLRGTRIIFNVAEIVHWVGITGFFWLRIWKNVVGRFEEGNEE